jgi:nicotinamidase-related amidase
MPAVPSFARLNAATIAHVCVDMQNLVGQTGPWHAPWSGRVLPEIVRLCERLTEQTIFTRFIPPPTPDDMPGRWKQVFEKWPQVTGNVIEPDLLDLMAPLTIFTPPAIVIDKRVYSPFTEPTLQQHLAARQVSALVVSGVETEVCVLATVLGAIDLGYHVVIPLDAVCSSSDTGHDALVTMFQQRFSQQIETTTVDDILQRL